MTAETLTPNAPVPPAQTLIFSSESAVAASRGLNLSHGLVAWCVGPRTAAAAQRAGFRAVENLGDGEALAMAMIAAKVSGPCLFLRGQDIAGDIAGQLNSAGIETHSLIVYRQSPQPLSVEGHALLLGFAPILLPLFSPRSARLAAAAGVATARAPLWLACLSPAIAAAAQDIPSARHVTAQDPTGPAMLDALATLLSDAP